MNNKTWLLYDSLDLVGRYNTKVDAQLALITNDICETTASIALEKGKYSYFICVSCQEYFIRCLCEEE